MTDKEQLAHLLADCVQKANTYLDEVRIQGQFDPSVKGSRLRWEQAEEALATRLALIEEDMPLLSAGQMAEQCVN